MKVTYNESEIKLKPARLSNDTLLGMGRLVRAFAEIEDIITLHICKLVDISPGKAIMLMGRRGIKEKVNLLLLFANQRGGVAQDVAKQAYDNDVYRKLVEARNVVAHGVLLGETEEGRIAFQTSTVLGAEADINEKMARLNVEVAIYTPSDFKMLADTAEDAIDQIENALGLKGKRLGHHEQVVGRHPKAQPIRAPSAPHQRQQKPDSQK